MATVTETTEVTEEAQGERAPKPIKTVLRTEKKERIPALPRPPGWKVKPAELFKYWHEVEKKHPDRMLGYIYRLWPIINRNPAYIAIEPKAFAAPEIEDIQQEFFHRWGSGDYKIILSDGLAKKGVCQTRILGLRDKERPPAIEKLSELIMTDPSNRQYLEDLRMRGVALPGEARYQEEGEEVGQTNAMTEAVGRLTDTVDNLVDKVVEVSGRPAPVAPAPVEGKVGSVTLEIVQKATDMSNKIVDRAIDKAESMANRERDPVSTIREVAGVVKDLMPKDNGLLEVLRASQAENVELRRQMYESQQSELRETRELLRQNLAAKSATVTGAPGTPGAPLPSSGLAATLREIREIKDTMRDLFGGGSEEEEGNNPIGGKGLAGFLLSNLPYILSLGAAVVHNMAVAKTGQGQPVVPPAAPAGGEVKAPTALPPQDQALGQYHQFLAQLKPSLLLYLSDDRSGADYADFLMEMLGAEEGRLRYEAIREMGTQTLVQLLATYPPIWQVASQNPAKLEKFLIEFMNHDAIREEEDRQEQANARPKIVVRRAAEAEPRNAPLENASPAPAS